MKTKLLLLILIGFCAAVGGGVGIFLSTGMERSALAQESPPPASPTQAVVTDLLQLGDRFELVARRVAPAVVYVEAMKRTNRNDSSKAGSEESGSGVIVRLPGRFDYLVLTNNHVIADASAKEIVVQLADGRILNPKRVWTYPPADIALLSLESREDLPTAQLGNSDRLRVGHWVLAIGSPYGLNQTVTHGILSARERGTIDLGETIHIKNFLQTDAAINPGSSGGPLVNLNGEVIGINTAIASPHGANSGIAFSIPINFYKEIMTKLLSDGRVARGYIGVQLRPDFDAAAALKTGLENAQGAQIEIVFPNTPAAQAGLQVGDVILEMNGRSVEDLSHLINQISATRAGQPIDFTLWRENRRMNARVTVQNRP